MKSFNINFQAFLTEKYGRKTMLCVGYSIEAVSLLMITVFIQIQYISAVFPYMSVISSIGLSLDSFFIGYTSHFIFENFETTQ